MSLRSPSKEAAATACKVAVLTTTRADYGHLYWVLRALERSPGVSLMLYVSGTHLEPGRGATVSAIEADGFEAHRAVPIWEGPDTAAAIAAGLGRTLDRFGAALSEDRPDVMVVLGDRAEALAVALACVVVGLPVAHLHGGETSLGSLDELYRHAISKLSSLHFPATEGYARRLRQMGEDPARVHALGAPGLDHVYRTELLGREELAELLGLPFDGRTAVVTFHPVTTDPGSTEASLDALLQGLDGVPNLRAVFTGSNADEGGARIDASLRAFCSARPARFKFFQNLGTQAYLSCLKHCDVVVGNSSSGIIEAPSFGTPTVNVGPRQEGRVRAVSVIDVPSDTAAIEGAVRKALSQGFRGLARGAVNPYDPAGDGRVSERIAERLLAAVRAGLTTSKRFHDVDAPYESRGAV